MAKGDKEGSVAPRERVNIVYKPATGDAQEEVELPLKLLVVGDYTGRADDRPLEERKPINVDKDNFDDVLKSQELKTEMSVPDRISGQGEMAVSLRFDKLSDFGPEAVAEQIPNVKEALEVRDALTALKAPLGNEREFRKALEKVLKDEDARKKLLEELGLEDKGEG